MLDTTAHLVLQAVPDRAHSDAARTFHRNAAPRQSMPCWPGHPYSATAHEGTLFCALRCAAAWPLSRGTFCSARATAPAGRSVGVPSRPAPLPRGGTVYLEARRQQTSPVCGAPSAAASCGRRIRSCLSLCTVICCLWYLTASGGCLLRPIGKTVRPYGLEDT